MCNTKADNTTQPSKNNFVIQFRNRNRKECEEVKKFFESLHLNRTKLNFDSEGYYGIHEKNGSYVHFYTLADVIRLKIPVITLEEARNMFDLSPLPSLLECREKGFVIEVLDPEHGRKVKDFFNRIGEDTTHVYFNNMRLLGDVYRYYGNIQKERRGYIGKYSHTLVIYYQIPILTLEQAEEIFKDDIRVIKESKTTCSTSSKTNLEKSIIHNQKQNQHEKFSNFNPAKIQRKVVTITTGERFNGNRISGKLSKTAITSRPLSHKTIIGY